jgi:hypothetical protein
MSKKLLELIPNSVRIKHNINYEVVWCDSFPNPKQVGECRPAPIRQIVIKKGESPTETYKTFIHETLHAINFECEGLTLTENQTGLLENELFRVMKLNKLLEVFLKNR